MKRNLLVALLGMIAVAFALGTYAVVDAEPRYHMVSEAEYARDGSELMMRGWFTEELQSGKYLFTDASGYIRVELDETDYVPVIDNVARRTDAKGHAFKEYVATQGMAQQDVRVELVGILDSDGEGKVFHAQTARVIDVMPGQVMRTDVRLTNTGGPGADD